ncbi:MAG: hypothetical protein SGI77_00045 [Pirellulaceae bacterium]|nr:hypothetical protein [Pirellulaceae bacterium]
MRKSLTFRFLLGSAAIISMAGSYAIQAQEDRPGPPGAQRPDGPPRGEGRPGEGRPGEGRPGEGRGGPGGQSGPGEGRGGPGGPGGFGRINPIMMALDTNKDGVLTKEEIDNAIVALTTLDKNKDGKLTEDELRPAGGPPGGFGGPGGGDRGPGGGDRGGGPGRGGPGGGGAGGAGGASNPEDIVNRFLQFDGNKDNQLSKDELPERMHGLITRADSNNDGIASKDELLAMAKKEMAEGGGGRPPEAQSDRRPQRPE